MRLNFMAGVSGAALAVSSLAGGAPVDLEFRPDAPVIDIGDVVVFDLVAVSDGVQTISAAEAVFEWDDEDLLFLGLDPANPADLIFSGFPALGSGGLNEADPPQDGDGYYIALGPLGVPIVATEAGTVLARFRFEAISSSPAASVDLLASGGSPVVETKVFDGQTPNTVVTGTLTGGEVAIRCGPFDVVEPFGILDLADVNAFVNAFEAQDPIADLNNNGVFDLHDINAFIVGFLAGCL